MRNNAELLKSYYESNSYFTLYDKLGYFSGTKKEVDFIINNIQLEVGDKILDLGCGQGRHSIEFALKGFDVSAVDFSEFLIKQARAEAQKNEVKIKFKRMDMRQIRFKNRFNLVICLFSSFGLFSKKDNSDLLFRIFYSLIPNGYFILDVDNLFRLLKCLEIDSCFNKIQIEHLDLIEKLNFNRRTKVLKWEEIYQQQSHCGYYQYYSKSELKELLRSAGFRIINVFGSFDGEAYSKNSERLIFICQKI